MAYSTRSGRTVKEKFCADYIDLRKVQFYERKKTRVNKLWSIDEVLEERDGEVLVKWMGYGEEENSWVNLADNPELSAYLSANAGNPVSSAVANQDLPRLTPEERELWLVKHAVFDELQFRRTPEQDTGLERRVQVKVPFSKEAFTSYFEKGTFPLGEERGLDFSGTRNIRFSCTAEEISTVFGMDMLCRQFERSSTVCEVDPASKVYVSWGYELRINYDHSSCPRCTYVLEAGNQQHERPATCSPSRSTLPPISYLSLSFKKRRRNMIQSQGH